MDNPRDIKQEMMDNIDEYKRGRDNWRDVKREMCDELGYNSFVNWIKGLDFIRIQNSHVILETRNNFYKSEITKRYSTLLLELWQKRNADILGVDILPLRRYLILIIKGEKIWIWGICYWRQLVLRSQFLAYVLV